MIIKIPFKIRAKKNNNKQNETKTGKMQSGLLLLSVSSSGFWKTLAYTEFYCVTLYV